jgi:hypothetical protein
MPDISRTFAEGIDEIHHFPFSGMIPLNCCFSVSLIPKNNHQDCSHNPVPDEQ